MALSFCIKVLCIFYLVLTPRVWGCSQYRPYMFPGPVHGALVLIIWASIVICCVAPCCFCYKICRKRQQKQMVVTTMLNTLPQPPHSPENQAPPLGCQTPPPGYQAVAGHEGSVVPPFATPSYMESTAPSSSNSLPNGQLMFPLTPTNQT